MPKFATPIDLSNLEIQNVRLQHLGSNPSILSGLFFLNTADGNVYAGNAAGSLFLRLNNLSAAEILASLIGVDGAGSGLDADLLDGQNGLYYLARANHTGTQLASTVSDFDTQVRTNRLDQMAAPTASVSFNSQEVTNVATPGSGTSAANKNYVDALMTGSRWKDAVRVASTANVTISGPGASIDGVALVAGDRVLLKNQTTAADNGIYVWNGAAVAMTRATDADSSAEVKTGMSMMVSEGATLADTQWTLTTNDPISLGSTALAFIQIGASTSYTAGAGLTLAGNQFSISTSYLGQTSITTLGTIATGTWQGTTIALNKGGTGATDASGARTNLNAAGIYTATLGDGVATTFSITQATHGLANVNKIIVAVYEVSSGDQIFCNVSVNNTNGTVSLAFSVAPTTNQYRIVIHG